MPNVTWTPAERQRASEAARERYWNTPIEERRRWHRKGKLANAANHPDRAATRRKLWGEVKAGERYRPSCGDCVRPMHPRFNWSAEGHPLTHWKCYGCGLEVTI